MVVGIYYVISLALVETMEGGGSIYTFAYIYIYIYIYILSISLYVCEYTNLCLCFLDQIQLRDVEYI